ncbi:MAG: osmoprotectant ABC transporter substrate-binding protein, partial [Firmicutes bacterium]|nr:osmoprotectant ABC transporter substrate-binding protein [Bacillota bacterium]
MTKSRLLTMALAAVVLVAAFSGMAASSRKQITVASFNFSETLIMAEIFKQIVEANTDIQVRHVPNMEFRVVVSATQTGEIDAYVTYSGTQFTTVLGQEVTEEWTDPKKVLGYARREVDRQYGMTLLDPLGFDNTYAVAVRREFAEKHGLRTVSDLRPHAPNMVMATDQDFLYREEVMSYKNFVKVYDIKFRRAIAMTYGLLYRAVRSGDVDAIMAYSSDGRIASMNLVVLEDDKQFFPPYDAMFIIRNETLKKYPELRGVLDRLAGAIDQETAQKLNARTDVDEVDPKIVARDFLREKGL